jgi:hypothetical protein
MLTRRSLLQLVPRALLVYGMTNRLALADETDVRHMWSGEHVRRISRDEHTNLSASMRTFCGQSRSRLIPDAGPLLSDQFAAVGFMMEEYRLPNGRLILNQSYGRAGIDSIVVKDPRSTENVLAAAILTHLYPVKGVEENFVTFKGVRYEGHVSSEWDYSLVIFYPRGSVKDRNLTSDLTNWAKARAATTISFARLDRKLLLKRFVRILKA